METHTTVQSSLGAYNDRRHLQDAGLFVDLGGRDRGISAGMSDYSATPQRNEALSPVRV